MSYTFKGNEKPLRNKLMWVVMKSPSLINTQNAMKKNLLIDVKNKFDWRKSLTNIRIIKKNCLKWLFMQGFKADHLVKLTGLRRTTVYNFKASLNYLN